MFIYTRGDFLYPFQPSRVVSVLYGASLASYLFDLLKSQVPSVEELAARERSSIASRCREHFHLISLMKDQVYQFMRRI